MPRKSKDIEEDVSDSGSDEDVKEEETEQKREPYNNQELMKVRLEQIKSKLDWFQHLDVSTDMKEISTPSTEDDDNPTTKMEDDFKREMVFYCQAQVAAKEAMSKLRVLGISTRRPDDYFAEMVKSDVHMQKIRQKLLNKKDSMEKSEKAKKQRQLKKFGKKIQQEVLQKRQQEKKKVLQAVDRIKKNKNKLDKLSGQNGDMDEIFNINTDDKKSNKTKSGQKRKYKDEKFGFGGKKRKMKKNSAETPDEVERSFKRGIHGNKNNGKAPPGKFSRKFNGREGASKGKPNRPANRLGKSRRMQGRKKH